MSRKSQNSKKRENAGKLMARKEDIVAVIHEEMQHYSGPTPPASEMAKWEEICPGSADRILTMAESAQKH